MIDSRLEIPFLYGLREKMDMWNIQGTKFFRTYVYNRVMAVTQKPFVSMIIVFMINAMWHGVYPCYFIVLMTLATCIASSKCYYRFYENIVTKITIIPNNILNTIAIFTSTFYSYAIILPNCIMLDLLDAQRIYIFMKDLYFYPIILPLVGVLFFKLTGIG